MRLRGSDPQDATYRQSTRIHGGAIVVAMKKARPGSDFRKSFAANLRRERRALGLSQKALAHMAGLDRTYVGSVERAESNISIDNIERLARALGLEPADLFKQNRS
jgi:ribosome-binding protein aMBF1 (putative translation factor)